LPHALGFPGACCRRRLVTAYWDARQQRAARGTTWNPEWRLSDVAIVVRTRGPIELRCRAISAAGPGLVGNTGRSNGQTSRASNPATAKPPSSIDQSPVSKPRSRPSFVRRSVASRSIGITPVHCRAHRTAKCAANRQSVIAY